MHRSTLVLYICTPRQCAVQCRLLVFGVDPAASKRGAETARIMASKTALMTVLLLVLVTGDLVHGHALMAGDLAHGHAVPLGRHTRPSLGWMQGMKGGPPSGMQLSDTAAAARRRAISSMQKGEERRRRDASREEGKFIAPVPSFKLPPLPPNAP
ncbi:hypothetical protein VPH35_113367 [Triticum aestivum]